MNSETKKPDNSGVIIPDRVNTLVLFTLEVRERKNVHGKATA